MILQMAEPTILWCDASVLWDHERGEQLSAGIAVVDGDGEVLLCAPMGPISIHRAERLAITAAFRIARRLDEGAEIRTDSSIAAKSLTAPKGSLLVQVDRSGNLAHVYARQAARAAAGLRM